jgi:hypothetical protein
MNILAGSFAIRQSKTILARSGEPRGRQQSIDDSGTLRFSEIARVLVRFNHVASVIVDAGVFRKRVES